MASDDWVRDLDRLALLRYGIPYRSLPSERQADVDDLYRDELIVREAGHAVERGAGIHEEGAS